MKELTNAAVEALKEALRLITFALPAILIQVVSSRPTLTNTAIGGLILVGLRALDKYIHLDPNIKAKGLVPW